ncbi:hypothetical protein [Nocardiopsis synnemataformans]|uniref:hypothetical protein n=1 Tax=Nocardiopsis synnemataformans TaxID=61305 RepID=UPI003EB6BAAE
MARISTSASLAVALWRTAKRARAAALTVIAKARAEDPSRAPVSNPAGEPSTVGWSCGRRARLVR